MSFRDFQYSFGKFKTNVEGQFVKHIPYKNQDTKQLSLWIFRERDDLSSLRTLAYQHSETNKALSSWINEDENNADLKDLVGDKIVKLLDKQVEIEQEYADKIQLYRQAIKSIRIREERVSDVRELKRALQSRLAQLESAKRKQPERISDTLSQLASVEQDAAVEEQELAEFKRLALREAFYLRFNALTAYAEKANMIAGFGKYLTDLFEVSEKETVYNQKVANTIFSDAVEALDRWVPTQSDERPTINESLPKKDIDDKKKKSKKKKDQDEDDGKKGKSKTNKKNKKKKEQKQDQEEHDEEVEEPLTPPELPPRLAHHQPFSVSENPPTPYLEYDHYHQRAHSSSSMMSTDSRDQYEFYQAPPPSYDLSQTSLTESNSNTSPTIIRSEVQQQTKDDDDDDDDTDHLNSGPSSLLPFLTYYPVEHIHRQVQNNNKHNNRSYMEFSLQYAHRPVQQLSPAPPLPPPRSRSVTTLPLSMSAPSAPSAPTQDEIHFLPIPSAPPPSELSEY